MKRRLLIVEDNLDVAESLGMLLRLWGHEVECAADVRSALETAESFRPEIVLLDIGLPHQDGYQVGREIRARLGGSVLLVAITGRGRKEDLRRSKEAGFDLHLTKPLDPSLLEAFIASA